MAELVRVVVASSSCLAPDAAAAMGITVVPLRLHIGDDSYRDQVDIGADDFYRRMRTSPLPPSTSAPTVGDYLDAFVASPGDVLCLVDAQTLTSMYSSARTAAEMTPATRVTIVDTNTAAGGVRLLALAAAQLAQAGMQLTELEAEVRALSQGVRVYGALETLQWLARGGRIPQAASWGSRILAVRPIIEFSHGRARLLRLARGRHGARRALVRVLQHLLTSRSADAVGLRVAVMHADATVEAEALGAEIEAESRLAEVSISAFTPAMGVHTGPGLVGFAICDSLDRAVAHRGAGKAASAAGATA